MRSEKEKLWRRGEGKKEWRGDDRGKGIEMRGDGKGKKLEEKQIRGEERRRNRKREGKLERGMWKERKRKR